MQGIETGRVAGHFLSSVLADEFGTFLNAGIGVLCYLQHFPRDVCFACCKSEWKDGMRLTHVVSFGPHCARAVADRRQ